MKVRGFFMRLFLNILSRKQLARLGRAIKSLGVVIQKKALSAAKDSRIGS